MGKYVLNKNSERTEEKKVTNEITNEFSKKLFKSKNFLTKKETDNFYINEHAVLINGEALEEMKNLKSESIDCIIADLPYGTTMNPWDSVIPLHSMWKQFNRILKKGGNIILTASQPFTSILVASNLKQFKYEIIWEKTIGSGQLNINIMPLKKHESILVFVKEGNKRTYNEQLSEGAPYTIKRNIGVKNGYGKQAPHKSVNDGFRRETSIWKIANPRIKNGHPTQKPLELLQKIVKTYSNENELILDCTFGSCSTGVACLLEKRNFIGIELDPNYFKKGVDWISETQR